MAGITAAEVASKATAICAEYGNDPAELIEILHDLQDALGFVPEDALVPIAKALNLGKAEIHGVVSFYHDFRASPPGKVVVKLCEAEACQSMASRALKQAILARYGAKHGAVEIHPVYCLGNCALSPAAEVNGRLHGRLDEQRLSALIGEALA